MKKDTKLVSLFVVSFAGLLFSGYLSGIKFFTETCAFNESCPYFLGYPACYYGFVMYLALTIYSYLIITNRLDVMKGSKSTLVVSGLGILFSGYFTLKEIPILFEEGLTAYALGLPTCALGLIFYIIVFILSFRINKTDPL